MQPEAAVEAIISGDFLIRGKQLPCGREPDYGRMPRRGSRSEPGCDSPTFADSCPQESRYKAWRE